MKEKTLKIFACVFAVSILLFSLTGCGSKKAIQDPKLSTKEITQKILKNVTDTKITDTVTYGDEKYEKNFDSLYNFSMDLISDGTISFAATGGYADEISLLYIKSTDDIQKVVSALKTRITERESVFSGYKPKEVEKLGQAQVLYEGHYVILIICDDTDSVANEFYKILGD